MTLHQDDEDPGKHGDRKVRQAFAYSFSITGNKPLTVNNKLYTEPTVVPAGQAILTWLRSNAFTSKGSGWFAAGYGPFRRLTRDAQIIIPSLKPPTRWSNFKTQFDDDALAILEQWMTYLDYRKIKEEGQDDSANLQFQIAVGAINRVLPKGAEFYKVTSEGRLLFKIGNQVVPTISMSDGYRSILAFVGDLVWRLLNAFPESLTPLSMPGVVLIDELDIHLHPTWQRDIASILRDLFPRIQFFVATHSPLVAAGAGDDAMTLKCDFVDGKSTVRRVENIGAMSVDRVLQSKAFGLVSTLSPQVQRKVDRYDQLVKKKQRTEEENSEFQGLLEFMRDARPVDGRPAPDSLEDRIEKYLEKVLP